MAEAPVDIGGRQPGPPASSPGGGLQTGTAGPKARGIAYSYLQSWRGSSERRPLASPPGGDRHRRAQRGETALRQGADCGSHVATGATPSTRVARSRAMLATGRRAAAAATPSQATFASTSSTLRPWAGKTGRELRLGKVGKASRLPGLGSHGGLPDAARRPRPPNRPTQKPPTKPAPPAADRPPSESRRCQPGSVRGGCHLPRPARRRR